ncbi:HupE/UreJ family protein [Marinobacter changyiensis]|uniref:HupE/UreJ family protein n=1 Tax=Marinobacter changyiensis TaxID=2604091 RepID=UPI0012642B2A|nr:HupE/UreJ family protein [Marinobacter changyiensis]
MTRGIFILLVALSSWLPLSASGHALDPGYLELSGLGDERWRVTWRVPDVNGRPMPIQVILPAACEATSPPEPSFDGRAWVAGWIATCRGGLAGGEIRIAGLEKMRTDTLVRYELDPGKTQVHRLTSDSIAFQVPDEAGVWDIVASYVVLGITHILEGVDHLLFVFALLLLIKDWRRLFWTITAFTAAHSMTLASASLGWISLPSPPVEAVIALSIVFLAYELARPPEQRDAVTERFPWLVSFAFGLIHGLGFAGALAEIGLPDGDIPLSLFAFNVGVEMGQILFIVVVLALGALLRRLFVEVDRHSRVLTQIASYPIGGVAAFRVIERMTGF